jgi:hypothetical protein
MTVGGMAAAAESVLVAAGAGLVTAALATIHGHIPKGSDGTCTTGLSLAEAIEVKTIFPGLFNAGGGRFAFANGVLVVTMLEAIAVGQESSARKPPAPDGPSPTWTTAPVGTTATAGSPCKVWLLTTVSTSTLSRFGGEETSLANGCMVW